METTILLRQAAEILRSPNIDDCDPVDRQVANWLEHMAMILGYQRYQNQSPPGKEYAISVAQAVIEKDKSEASLER